PANAVQARDRTFYPTPPSCEPPLSQRAERAAMCRHAARIGDAHDLETRLRGEVFDLVGRQRALVAEIAVLERAPEWALAVRESAEEQTAIGEEIVHVT